MYVWPAGPMVKHFGLQGLTDTAVHTQGYRELQPDASASEANNAVREIAAANPDTAHTLWKQIDRAYLKPLFGGRSSGQPHLYELNTAESEDAEVVDEGLSPNHHILEMQTSGLDNDTTGADGTNSAYQPPHASDSPFGSQPAAHRNQAGRTSLNGGLPHGHAEDT